MKKVKKSFFGKYSQIFYVSLTVLIVGIILTVLYVDVNKKSILREYKNDYYAFSYDNSWNLSNKKDDGITLKHHSGSELDIIVRELDIEYQYTDISALLDEFIYSIQKSNPEYKLIYQESKEISKNSYDGYELLYENNDKEVLVVMYKNENKLIIFTYEAVNSYFDILLDSVLNIINSFDINSIEYNYSYKIKLDNSKISFNNNNFIDSKMNNVSDYETYNNNYHLNYSIPSNFRISEYNTMLGLYDYNDLENGTISLEVKVLNKNIYEYLDKNNDTSLYHDYKSVTENKNKKYNGFIENLSKIDDHNYIYKNSYTYSYDDNDKVSTENVSIIYVLDNNHLAVFSLIAIDTNITQKMVEQITLNKYNNYSSYILNNKENNNYVYDLKHYANYNKDSVEVIKLKVPTKYQERYMNDVNMFEERKLGLNYNNSINDYDYLINYEVYSSIESGVSLINFTNSIYKTSGDYNELKTSGNTKINNKNFIVYNGFYNNNYKVNEKVLFYKLDSGKILGIEIKGNNKTISDSLLKEITNFEVIKENV